MPDGHDLEADDVALGVADIAEEVGDAEPAVLVLAREGEARQLALAVVHRVRVLLRVLHAGRD